MDWVGMGRGGGDGGCEGGWLIIVDAVLSEARLRPQGFYCGERKKCVCAKGEKLCLTTDSFGSDTNLLHCLYLDVNLWNWLTSDLPNLNIP